MITKSQLGEFESISIFDSKFIKVCRDGLFNLIDTNNGQFLSNEWFVSIEKSDGGGFNVVKKEEPHCSIAESSVKNRTRQFKSVESFRRAESVQELLDNISSSLGERVGANWLHAIDFDNVVIFDTPVRESVVVNNAISSVEIVAKVLFMGDTLYLGRDGRLYVKDIFGRCVEFNMVNFSVSYTDINRLGQLAEDCDKLFNHNYDPYASTQRSVGTIAELKDRSVSFFIFGFTGSKCFIVGSHKDGCVCEATKAWGGDSIKLRFIPSNVSFVDSDKFKAFLLKEGFKTWLASTANYGQVECLTKEFAPTDIDTIFTLLSKMKNIETYD